MIAVSRRKLPAHLPGGLFQSPSAAARLGGHFDTPDRQGNCVFCAETAHEISFVTALGPQTMIEVGGRQIELQLGGQLSQQVQQADRIGAAGNSDQHPVSCPQQAISQDHPADGFLHARCTFHIPGKSKTPSGKPERVLPGMVAVQRFELRTLRI